VVVGPGQSHCYAHDPTRAEERRRNASRGGKSKSAGGELPDLKKQLKDLAADVLFAFDSAELSPDARRRVQQLGTEVAGRAAPGQVSIVGHTDAEASDAYNDDLSRRRAQAVADVLSPMLAPAGVTLVVEGRGEREPVADNATPEGRQLNRRVSVGFTEEAS